MGASNSRLRSLATSTATNFRASHPGGPGCEAPLRGPARHGPSHTHHRTSMSEMPTKPLKYSAFCLTLLSDQDLHGCEGDGRGDGRAERVCVRGLALAAAACIGGPEL